MSRFFKFAMLTTLALAAVAWTAGPAMAQRGGHGGGRGGHGGGGGGWHGGGGGWHGGGGGWHGGYGHRGFGYGGWGGFYPGYGYSYPSYGYGYAYPSYGYSDSGYTYDSGVPYIVGSAPLPAEAAQNYTYTEHRDGDNIGRVHVHVPANAKVWVDGEATKQKGSDRDFMTPPLRGGRELTYTIKAQWNQDGQNVERTRQVRVKANDTANIDFTAPKKEVERTTAK